MCTRVDNKALVSVIMVAYYLGTEPHIVKVSKIDEDLILICPHLGGAQKKTHHF